MKHTCPLSQNNVPTTDQNTNTTKVQRGEPRSFMGDVYRNVGVEILTGAENDSKRAVSPKPLQAWVTAHKAGKLERTAQPAGS